MDRVVMYSDASVKQHVGVGIGYVLKELTITMEEEEIEAGTDRLSGSWNSEEAEMIACLRGIKEARKYDYDSISIRVDAVGLVERIKQDATLSDDGKYMKAFRSLINGFDSYSIQWIAREKNGEADALAHTAVDGGA